MASLQDKGVIPSSQHDTAAQDVPPQQVNPAPQAGTAAQTEPTLLSTSNQEAQLNTSGPDHQVQTMVAAQGTNEGTSHQTNASTSSSSVAGEGLLELVKHANLPNTYQQYGQPLHTKATQKIKEKIWAGEFVHMQDVLVDPGESDFSLGMSAAGGLMVVPNKKKKFLTIEAWTDAFNVFASVARCQKPELHEKLAIYMETIRRISRDGGNWYFYDTNFRRTMQQDSSCEFNTILFELHSRALIKKPTSAAPTHAAPKSVTSQPFRERGEIKKYCFPFNRGEQCKGCKFPHLCFICSKPHPKTQCPSNKSGIRSPPASVKTEFERNSSRRQASQSRSSYN